jgi:beta-glucosidase
MNAAGAMTVSALDAGAQENARQAVWSGEGTGTLSVLGRPVDLSRQTTGDMAVMIRYRVDASPGKPVSLGMGCGESCGAQVDVTSTFQGAKIGEWRTAKIRLSCFMAKGADMTQISAPFALSTSGRFSLAFTEIRLASNEGDAFCPTH